MGTIAKIDGVTWASIAKRNGVAVASIAKINGVDKPAGGFDPSDYGTLEWWYDASQLVGYSNGDSLTSWPDLSGNSRDLDSTAFPSFQTDGGVATSVYFDGNEWLRYNTAFTQHFESSLFVVFKNVSASTKQIFIEGGTAASFAAFAFYGDNNAPWMFKSLAYYCVGVNDWSGNAWGLAEVHYDGSSEAEYVLNGTSQSNGTVTGSPSTGSYSGVLNIGSRNGGAAVKMNGYLAELMRYNAKLSSGNIATVRAALKAKWGTP